MRNAAAEATQAVGGARARVLEPSPPAVVDEFFADDPVNTEPAGDGPIISPVANGDQRWADVAADGELAEFAMANWLGPYKRLGSPPVGYVATRLALHRVSAYIISPARRRVNDKIGLRYTQGGFGTPFYGDDVQMRTAGAMLIVQEGSEVRSTELTTLNELGEFVASPPDVAWASEQDIPEPGDLDAPLDVDLASAAFLGDWFGFGFSVLEEVRSEAASTNASRIQLWPEHFDPAFEMLDDPLRASYGASPGDHTIDEPYLYVGPWTPDKVAPNEFWGSSFAALRLSEFVDADDQRGVAGEFLRKGRDLLAASA